MFMALFLSLSAFGINSILYQRGIYPSETFTRVQKYGLTLLVTTDPELIKYLNNVVEQLKGNHVLSFTPYKFAFVSVPSSLKQQAFSNVILNWEKASDGGNFHLFCFLSRLNVLMLGILKLL